MCNETAGNRINAGEIQNENRFLIFLFIENRLKIPVPRGGGGGRGKSGSGATTNKMAVVLQRRSVPCCVSSSSCL